MSDAKLGSAVVMGGSLAGLLAARALAIRAEEVVIVERDVLADEAQPRRGVPQGRQIHALHARGLTVMESMLPGLGDDLVAGGAERGDVGIDVQWYVDGLRRPLVATGTTGISCSRPLLEQHVRRKVLAWPNVSVRRANVTGISHSAGRVDGVLIADRPDGEPGEEGAVDRLAADLVVDATGRSTRVPTCLAELGYGVVPERQIRMDIGYGSRYFRREPGERLDGAIVALSLASPKSARARGALVAAIEGDRWLMMVGGYHHDRPTADTQDFTARALDDPAVVFGKLVQRAEPVSEVLTYRYPASLRRDYSKLDRFPAGLVPVGDAVASFNPVYGQGMTCAALYAEQLGAWVAERPNLDEPASAYLRRAEKVANSPWDVAAAEDFRLAHVVGDRPRGLAVAQRVGALFAEATRRDEQLHATFLKVISMQADPTSMMRPGTIVRALRAARRPLPGPVGRA